MRFFLTITNQISSSGSICRVWANHTRQQSTSFEKSASCLVATEKIQTAEETTFKYGAALFEKQGET